MRHMISRFLSFVKFLCSSLSEVPGGRGDEDRTVLFRRTLAMDFPRRKSRREPRPRPAWGILHSRRVQPAEVVLERSGAVRDDGRRGERGVRRGASVSSSRSLAAESSRVTDVRSAHVPACQALFVNVFVVWRENFTCFSSVPFYGVGALVCFERSRAEF